MADLRKNPEPIADKRAHFGSGGAVTVTACFMALLGGLLLASSYWREGARCRKRYGGMIFSRFKAIE